MVKILFICHGNICRSPMAEYLMKDLVRRRGMEGAYEISSAATSAEEIGNGVYPPARRELERHGIPCGSRRARRMTKEDIARYDLVVCMDRANLKSARSLAGDSPGGRISLLLDFAAGRKGQEVADPWYTGDFGAALRDITEGCEGLLRSTAEAAGRGTGEEKR